MFRLAFFMEDEELAKQAQELLLDFARETFGYTTLWLCSNIGEVLIGFASHNLEEGILNKHLGTSSPLVPDMPDIPVPRLTARLETMTFLSDERDVALDHLISELEDPKWMCCKENYWSDEQFHGHDITMWNGKAIVDDERTWLHHELKHMFFLDAVNEHWAKTMIESQLEGGQS